MIPPLSNLITAARGAYFASCLLPKHLKITAWSSHLCFRCQTAAYGPQPRLWVSKFHQKTRIKKVFPSFTITCSLSGVDFKIPF